MLPKTESITAHQISSPPSYVMQSIQDTLRSETNHPDPKESILVDTSLVSMAHLPVEEAIVFATSRLIDLIHQPLVGCLLSGFLALLADLEGL